MTYKTTKIGDIVAAVANNWFRPSFLRALARTTVNWKFAAGTKPKIVPLQSLVQSHSVVSISVSGMIWGETQVEDLVALCTLVSLRQPVTIFEFGTFTGHTTLNLAMNAKKNARILTLDIPREQRTSLKGLNWEKEIDDDIIGSQYRDGAFASQITQIFEDSRLFDPSPYLGEMDFIFVDACHEPEFVINDSKKAFQMLSEDGIVAWHDYSRACPGVTQYLDNLAAKREVFLIQGTQIAFCRGRV